MLDGIEAVTRDALSLALDAAAMRHQLIANNIANANTVDFTPQRLNFDAHFQDARRMMEERGALDANVLAVARNTPMGIEPKSNAAGLASSVQLDAEVADMAQNAIQYQTLVKALSRQMGILALAVSDGKR